MSADSPGFRFSIKDLPLGFDIWEIKDLRQAPWSGPLVPADTRAELERLRAIVRDVAALDPIQLYQDDWLMCAFCDADGGWLEQEVGPHDPGCPWLRATQEVTQHESRS